DIGQHRLCSRGLDLRLLLGIADHRVNRVSSLGQQRLCEQRDLAMSSDDCNIHSPSIPPVPGHVDGSKRTVGGATGALCRRPPPAPSDTRPERSGLGGALSYARRQRSGSARAADHGRLAKRGRASRDGTDSDQGALLTAPIGHMPAYGFAHVTALVAIVALSVAAVAWARRADPGRVGRILRAAGWALLLN